MFGELRMEDVWLGWKHRNESRMNEAMLGGAKATSVDPQNPRSNVFNGLKLLLNKRNLTGFPTRVWSSPKRLLPTSDFRMATLRDPNIPTLYC